MPLLATCLVLLFVPQEPAPTPQDLPAVLAAQETAGAQANPATLAQLAIDGDAPIALRAAWLLAHHGGKADLEPLHQVVGKSPHAEARQQAMQAVAQKRDAASLGCATDALRDADRSVRTLAAQMLGRLGRPAAVEPLLALIDEQCKAPAKPEPTDVQAALLSLADLGAAAQLLRAMTLLHDSKVEHTGEALTFACQTLVPKMAPAEQVTFLLSALGHREALVRRFAIGQLAERKDRSTVAALEARLATETRELRPLVETALAQVRGDRPQPTDELSRASHNAHALWQRALTTWNAMTPVEQALTAGAPVVTLLLLVVLVRGWRRRRAARAAAAATIALVSPSDDFAQRAEAEATRLAEAADAVANAPQPRAGRHGNALARR